MKAYLVTSWADDEFYFSETEANKRCEELIKQEANDPSLNAIRELGSTTIPEVHEIEIN